MELFIQFYALTCHYLCKVEVRQNKEMIQLEKVGVCDVLTTDCQHENNRYQHIENMTFVRSHWKINHLVLEKTSFQVQVWSVKVPEKISLQTKVRSVMAPLAAPRTKPKFVNSAQTICYYKAKYSANIFTT